MDLFKHVIFLSLAMLVFKSSISFGYAVVPKCHEFDLGRMIRETNDLSPDYQCEVSSILSRSSQPHAEWIYSLANPQIREVQFRAVVNLRGESNAEAPHVIRAGMIAKHIPVKDLNPPTINQITDFLTFVKNPAHQPVLVHCKAGQGRSGTFVATYRLAIENRSLEEVLKEAQAFNVNEKQQNFIKEFHKQLKSGQIVF